MQRTLIFILAILILVVIFALQNSDHVLIKLWFWEIDTSLALVLILTFTFGAILGILFSFPKKSRSKTDSSDLPEEQTQKKENGNKENSGDPEFEDIN